jgi:hypothetical protein
MSGKSCLLPPSIITLQIHSGQKQYAKVDAEFECVMETASTTGLYTASRAIIRFHTYLITSLNISKLTLKDEIWEHGLVQVLRRPIETVTLFGHSSHHPPDYIFYS